MIDFNDLTLLTSLGVTAAGNVNEPLAQSACRMSTGIHKEITFFPINKASYTHIDSVQGCKGLIYRVYKDAVVKGMIMVRELKFYLF